jgi:hypothetical protein
MPTLMARNVLLTALVYMMNVDGMDYKGIDAFEGDNGVQTAATTGWSRVNNS